MCCAFGVRWAVFSRRPWRPVALLWLVIAASASALPPSVAFDHPLFFFAAVHSIHWCWLLVHLFQLVGAQPFFALPFSSGAAAALLIAV